MSYITAADLRQYIGAVSTSDDTQLGFAASRAQQMIDTYCNRTFEATADTTRYYNALDLRYGGDVDAFSNELRLDVDLCQLTTVTNGNGEIIPNNFLVQLPTNFIPKYSIKIMMNTSYVWTYTGTPDMAISVLGRFAYSITAPADIVAACLALGKYIYKARTSTIETDRAVLSSDGIILPGKNIPDAITAQIEPYRRH
jgi:hypothetical protein